jgi:uncharacterized protein (TIGR00645 family)
MERNFERILFAMRWLLAPLYLGLGLILILFCIQLGKELLHHFADIWTMEETELVLAALTLIDMTLVASLIVMVMLSGYENFVSKLELEGAEKSLAWLGKLDAGSLKIKVAASIVAISSIHLLRAFMEAEHWENDKLILLIVTHLTFVVSALLLALMDRIIPLRR